MCVCACMHIVCAIAISACVCYVDVWVYQLEILIVRECVCVARWSPMVKKKGFYYVLVGRLGIITQAWLSTYNVVWIRERFQRKGDWNVWGVGDKDRFRRWNSALCHCTMGIGLHFIVLSPSKKGITKMWPFRSNLGIITYEHLTNANHWNTSRQNKR